MLAKIKDTEIVIFPYGYDDLQAENPYTKFTGNIDLLEIFPQTEEALLRGYELVQVITKDKPNILPIQEATLAQFPTWEDGVLVLDWEVSFKPVEV